MVANTYDSSWTPSVSKPGYVEKTMQHGACTIVVFRPILDPKEREKREKRAALELERGLREYIMKKQ